MIVRRRLAGIGSWAGSIAASAAGRREDVRERGDRRDPQRLAGRRDDAPGDGPRAGDGDLLADDRPHGDLERIDGARRTPPGRGGDERGEHRVGAEDGVDGDRVGVEVEQAAQAADGRAEVAPVLEAEPRLHDRPATGAVAGHTSATP